MVLLNGMKKGCVLQQRAEILSAISATLLIFTITEKKKIARKKCSVRQYRFFCTRQLNVFLDSCCVALFYPACGISTIDLLITDLKNNRCLTLKKRHLTRLI